MSHSIIVLAALAVGAALMVACRAQGAEAPATGKTSALDFTLTAIDGQPYPLAQHRGHVLLLVNVASKCGFTKQYDGLQQLYATYKDRGLVVIGIPSNDFLGQEPGTEAQIAEFCRVKFGVTFPLMAKVQVKPGAEQAPLYTWLTRESAKPGEIGWNFAKALIGRDGVLVERYGSRVAPDEQALVAAIEAALAAHPAPSATP